MHILVFPRAVINTIYLFNYINVIVKNMLYYVLASLYAHLFMFSYKLLTEIAIYFYHLNLDVNKMFVDKIHLTRQCNTESAELSR